MKIKPRIGALNISKVIFKTGVSLLLILAMVACSDDDDNGIKNLTPVDIVMIVDNSSDMTEEIQSLQDNIYASLAQKLEDASIDYRIILIGKYGILSDESVCIEVPLSGIVNCSNPPAVPINSTQFFHYSVEVSSTNSFCKILETLNTADEFNLAPNGWINWLRTNSVKFFLEFTTDGVNCFSGITYDDFNTAAGGTTAAEAFNTALMNLSPTHFGTSSNPNYRFFSILANPDNVSNNPALPYTVTDPITLSECPAAVNPGTGYQGLSILTNGVRFSLCQPNNYDLIFDAIGQEVINGASN